MPVRHPTSPQASVAKRLYEIAGQLRDGRSFMSTRLTLLKRACADPAQANTFALHVARLIWRNATQQRPRYIAETRWREYLPLMKQVIEAMQRVNEAATAENRLSLAAAVADLARLQSTVVHVSWNMVREIEYNEAFVMELAGQCMLDPDHAGRWAYHLARAYAERYNPRYGTGLIPESAPLVEDMAAFWSRLKTAQEDA